MNLNIINNIIFDFGGVIIDLDFSRTEEAFRKLGIADFMGVGNQGVGGDLYIKFEKGLITPTEFRSELKRRAGRDIPDFLLDDAWNALLLDIPVQRIKMLERLKAKYNIMLLSNSNQIHYDYYNMRLQQQHGYSSLDRIFHQTFFSFNMKLYKPDEGIYWEMIRTSGIIPEESVFIDDNEVNLVGAAKTGLQVLHSPQNIEIAEQLADW